MYLLNFKGFFDTAEELFGPDYKDETEKKEDLDLQESYFEPEEVDLHFTGFYDTEKDL